jgi:cell division protein FtsI (penicillin-binding protein 3)
MAMKNFRRNIIFKYALIYIVFFLATFGAILRMLRMQIEDGEQARRELQKRALIYKPVAAQRGNILAHDGNMLVSSMQKYELHYDFTAVKDNSLFNKKIDSIAHGLAAILGGNAAHYKESWLKERKRATEKHSSRYYPICRSNVDYPTMRRLRQLPLLRMRRTKGGLIIEPSIERIYLYDQLALHTLGIINKENQGVGIEYSYHKEIAGKSGWEWHRLVSKGKYAPIGSQPEVFPINGSDIVSTINTDMQIIAEEALIDKLRSTPDLEWGCAVIMDVRTGEVRAIVNKCKTASGSIAETDNYALRYRKDPGSTFKLVSILVFLEKGLDLNKQVDTKNGSIQIYDKTYYDESQRGGMLTAREVFENSSNVGAIQLAKFIYPSRSQWDDFMERIDALGIRRIVDFDIKPLTNINPKFPDIQQDQLALTAMTIGVGLEMTPLQTLAIFNAVANDGTMVHPRFIKEIRRDGKVVKSFAARKVVNKSICSAKTLEQLRQLLLGCVENGTARTARSHVLSIAGKTGTAHIAEGSKGYTNKKLASFAGYFPADNPRYSCIVAFRTYDTPNKTYGGQHAAPVFKNIAEKIYTSAAFWTIDRDWWQPDIAGMQQKLETMSSPKMPYSKSGYTSELYKVLDALGIPVHSKAAAQWTATSAADSAVCLQPRSMLAGLVPDVCGMGLKDAVYALEQNGLRTKFAGRGTIIAQNPAPGTACSKGDIVSLQLSINE